MSLKRVAVSAPKIRPTALAAELIVANAPDPVFVADLKGKILQANKAVSQLLGLRRDEVLEQSLARFLTTKETNEFVAAVGEVVARGVTRNVRLCPRSASGEVIPTTLNATALRDPRGEVIGVIGILRDMRAYDQVVRALEESRQELQAANRTKDEFLAMVSHELRTPLTAMLGWASMLRSGAIDDARAAHALEVIERNTKLLAQLIDDLLDLSRIVTGKLRLELRPVDSAGVVEAAIEAVQASADERAIELRAVVDPSAGTVLGDPSRLQQVVWNLLSNAIKFTPQHGRVELCLERVDAMARISVRDTGHGIRPDLLPHIFEPFRQAEDARRVGGLGLGLAIVRHIVELHHGTVRAESSGEGQGANFLVELPLMKEHVDAAEATPVLRGTEHHPSPGLTSLVGVNVLIVDDEADVRELLTMILHLAGAETATAASTAEALATLQQRRVDVLVSDLSMPVEDGYTLIRKLRELSPERGGTIPAIAFTSAARAEDRVRALSAGFQLHIVKPISSVELTAAIAQVTQDASYFENTIRASALSL